MTICFSVIIPAHNEEAVIERCLRAVYDGAPADDLPEVIVVANGCHDRTVEIARSVAPRAIVLDLPAGSKYGALNEGSRVSQHAPRLFLDADVQCDYRSLAATAEVLREPGVMAASPALRVDVSRCDWLVRAFYRVWTKQPYVTDRLVGSGLYGLSRDGVDAIGEFPPIFGDDIWIKTRFPYEGRRNVASDAQGRATYFTVSPPRTIGDLVKIEARRRIGDDEVRSRFPNSESGRRTNAGSLADCLGNGASVVDLGVYMAVKSLAKAKYRWNKWTGRGPVWTRDLAARQA